jgi:hypothetical protein
MTGSTKCASRLLENEMIPHPDERVLSYEAHVTLNNMELPLSRFFWICPPSKALIPSHKQWRSSTFALLLSI